MFQSLLKIYKVTEMGLGQDELLRPGQNGGWSTRGKSHLSLICLIIMSSYGLSFIYIFCMSVRFINFVMVSALFMT